MIFKLYTCSPGMPRGYWWHYKTRENELYSLICLFWRLRQWYSELEGYAELCRLSPLKRDGCEQKQPHEIWRQDEQNVPGDLCDFVGPRVIDVCEIRICKQTFEST